MYLGELFLCKVVLDSWSTHPDKYMSTNAIHRHTPVFYLICRRRILAFYYIFLFKAFKNSVCKKILRV